MTPQEIANKFASASSTCKNGKCPYTANCRGTTDTCKMKEVAMVIRSMMAEITTLQAKYNALREIANSILEYVVEVEKVNDHYYHVCEAFKNGYRPRKVPRKKKPRKKKTLVEMDGDERYAQVEPPKSPELPVVII